MDVIFEKYAEEILCPIIRDKFLYNCKKDSGWNHDRYPENLSQAIDCGFEWEKTPEGDEFWGKIHASICREAQCVYSDVVMYDNNPVQLKVEPKLSGLAKFINKIESK